VHPRHPPFPLPPQTKEKVAIIGSGNWGSAIAKVVGRNLQDLEGFEAEVRQSQQSARARGPRR